MKRTLCALALLCCIAAGALAAASDLVPVKIYLGSHDGVYKLNALGVRIEELRGGAVETRLSPAMIRQLEALGWKVEARAPEPADPKILSAYHHYNRMTAKLDSVHAQYPGITKKISIGQTVGHHQMWAFLVAKNPDSLANRAEVRFSSTIHGDERVGEELCIGMIDSLTKAYGTVPAVADLVTNREIWFMPLYNPDGDSANTRYNNNGEDLNRDFPVPDGGPNDGWVAGTEIETTNFMAFWSTKRVVLSTNYHGGATVCNYLWDYTYTRCPDDSLCREISLGYARLNPPMYNSTSFDSGVTNGADWYVVRGSLQDWCYQNDADNDITIELNDTKTPAASQLPQLWSDNRNAMLYLIRQAGWGVQGVVTDSLTGVPLNRVQVDVAGISKSVYTDTLVGDYHRMLRTGTYALTFSKAGYRSKTVSGVYAKLDSVTTLNVQLAPLTGVVSQPAERPLPIRTDLFYGRPNPLRDRTVIGYQLQRPGPASLRLYNAAGQLVRTLDQGQHSAGYHAVTWDGRDDHGAAVAAGVYIYRLDAGALTRTNKLVVVR